MEQCSAVLNKISQTAVQALLDNFVVNSFISF